MPSPEAFRSAFLDTKGFDPDTYVQIVDTVQRATMASLAPIPSDDPYTVGSQIRIQLPDRVARDLDPRSPMTRAAMMSGAVGYRGYMFRDLPEIQEQMRKWSFAELWHETSLARIAQDAEDSVGSIQLQLNGPIARISLPDFRDFLQGVEQGRREHVVITGLNGCGKTTVIEAIKRLTAIVGIAPQFIKFPRPDSTYGQHARSFLNKEDGYTSNNGAIQFVFLADAIDHEFGPNEIGIFDRHPVVEGMVYPQDDAVARMMLASQELGSSPAYRAVIIDRHPALTLDAVRKREATPRVFEQDMERMADHLVRFAALTTLPGYYWVSADTTGENMSQPAILRAQMRALRTIIYSGTLQRYMLREGMAESYEAAEKTLMDAYAEIVYGKKEPTSSPASPSNL